MSQDSVLAIPVTATCAVSSSKQVEQGESDSLEQSSEQLTEDAHDEDIGNEASSSGTAKKKKKKRKTPAQKRAAAALVEAQATTAAIGAASKASHPTPPVLKISRNKHLKYISSYHGPWLQLPVEVLQSLLDLNWHSSSRGTTRGQVEAKMLPYGFADRERFRALQVPLASDHTDEEDEPRLPPPIDPAAFRGAIQIRKLVEEACDLTVRAASGMSAAALGAFGSGTGPPDQALNGGRGGREPTMSPVRQHRLRALAVGKLAEAYRIDEIACSVAVMQSSTGLDDVASRVLKHDPDNIDAQYVHFFHEKIPSRTLASSTDMTVLDDLVLRHPTRLEFWRTRGVVHGFKRDYNEAIFNFTQALLEAKAARKAKQHHAEVRTARSSRKKGRGGRNDKAQGERDDSSASHSASGPSSAQTRDGTASIGKEAGDDLERQLLFHRGMAHFHSACDSVEGAVLKVEGVARPAGGLSNEGGELTLRNLGVVLDDEVLGLYGSANTSKKAQYHHELGSAAVKDKVTLHLRRSVRDMERFLSFFAVWDAPSSHGYEENQSYLRRPPDRPLVFRGRRLVHHRSLSDRTRLSDVRRRRDVTLSSNSPRPSALLTSYHPLLIEAHFSILLNLLLLGDFAALIVAHARTVRMMDYLEGYPVFLPARSLNQSEYAEVLERLAATWLPGRLARAPHSSHTEATEEEIAREGGDLAALQHLLQFFTPAYIDALSQQQMEEEEDRARQDQEQNLTESDVSLKRPIRVLTDSTTHSAAVEAERKRFDTSATYNTARAEVAVAWLSSVILPEKEAEEALVRRPVPRPMPDDTNGSDAGKGKGKGRARAVSNEEERVTNGHTFGSSRSTSPALVASTSRLGIDGDEERDDEEDAKGVATCPQKTGTRM